MATVIRLFDGLKNVLTGQGTGRDARMATAYAVTPMLTRQQIEAAYRGSGLLRKVVNIPALDMVREWRDWKLEAEQITLVEAEEKRLGIRQKIRQAEVLRGLGGGALILGLPGDPTQPAPTTTGTGALTFVHVVSRWHLTFSQTQDDARLDGYGEPLMWQMTTAGGQTSIHPSRVIPFRADTAGAMIATTMDTQDQFWGESTLQQVLDAVQDSDTARASFAALLHKARLTRIGIPGLAELVSTTAGEQALSSRLSMIALAESLHNAAVYDSGGEDGKGGEVITDAVYNFAGAKDVINAYGEFVAAISDIPATRLLGRAPEGMNSSGDSQQRDWEKRIRAMQTLDLAPCLDRLDRYLIPSALGTMPDGQWFDFAPLSLPSEAEETTRFKTLVESLQIVANMAVMPDRAFNEATQNALIETGMMPGLDTVLAALSEDERFGIEADPEGDLDEDPEEGGDPTASAGEGAAGLEADPPRRAANDASPRTLYVQRKLLNAAELIAWAKAQGFETTTPADELHCTVLYSKQAVDWMKMGSDWHGDDKGELIVPAGGARIVEPLGGKGAVVLLFASSALCWRHEEMVRNGASHDFPEYQPHVTITYAKPEALDIAAVEPFRGALRFGPEVFEEIKDGWQPSEA